MDEIRQQVDRLDKDVRALVEKINMRDENQLQIPIDSITENIINRDKALYRSTTTGATTAAGYITVSINGINYNVLIK